MIHAYQGVLPKIHPTAFVEASAQVIGDVELGADASVWFNVVIRADVKVAGGSVVAPGTKAARGSLLMGSPAKMRRSVTAEDLDLIHRSAENYIRLRAEYNATEGR